MSEEIDSDERNELDALRVENDTLRRHLGSLEEKVKRAEEHTAQGHAPHTKDGGAVVVALERPSVTSLCSSSTGKNNNLPEVRQLHGILQWLDKAKADIVDKDRSKQQLEGDVRLLYDLLERAKKERRGYGAVVKDLERSVAASEGRRAKVEGELELQQRSFAKVLLQDRDVYEARADAAEKRAQELKHVMTWVEKYEEKYVEAFGKLSAQAEEVGAANLGDLEGFTRDMAKDLRRMRKVRSGYLADNK